MKHIFSYSHSYNVSVQNSLVIISLIMLARSPTYWRLGQSKVPSLRIRPTLPSGQSNRCQLPYYRGASHSATRRVMYSRLFIILLSYVIKVFQISCVTYRKRDKWMVNKDVYFGITDWASRNVLWHFTISTKTIIQNKSCYQNGNEINTLIPCQIYEKEISPNHTCPAYFKLLMFLKHFSSCVPTVPHDSSTLTVTYQLLNTS